MLHCMLSPHPCSIWACKTGELTGEDSLVRVSDDKLPGHALALSLQKVWEIIRDQKDLNLPAHKVRALTTCTYACGCGSGKNSA